jgi:acid phosphatase (class A)
MKFRKAALGLWFFGGLFVSGMAVALDPTTLGKNSHYLPESGIQVESILAPPAPEGSQDDKYDLDAVLALQRRRTAADCARAQAEKGVSLEALFGGPNGTLSPDEVRRFTPFFDKIAVDAAYFAVVAKNKWNRPRPHNRPGVKRCVDLLIPNQGSYPSGHATIGQVYARVLSKIDPKREKAFLAQSKEIRRNRLVGGAHYPSDVEAGKKLGDAIADRLFKNEKFLADLAPFVTLTEKR